MQGIELVSISHEKMFHVNKSGGGIVFISTSNVSANAVIATCNRPTPLVPGDIMIAHWATRAAVGDIAMTLPNGWVQAAFNSVTNGPSVKLAYKIATASESASYDFTMDAIRAHSVIITVYRGVDTTVPADVVAVSNSDITGTVLTATGVTTVTPRSLLLTFFANAVVTSTAITPPVNMRHRASVTSQCRNTVSDTIIGYAGATGDVTATQAAATRWSAITWALRPGVVVNSDVNISVSGTPLLTNQMIPGVSYVDNPSIWRKAGWSNARVACGQAVGVHNIHIYPFGIRDPWTLNNPTGWTPGDTPNPALPNHLNDGSASCFKVGLDNIREISATDPIIVTLYGAPWWMKGRLQSNGTTIPCTYPADQFTDQGRVMTQYLPYWKILVTEACKIAMAAPYNVRWFQVWNELKGYYTNRTNTPQLWEWDYYSGTSGLNADHGYTWFYKTTVEAVLDAATALGIAADDIKIGGPYALIRSQGAIDADSVPSTGYPTLYNRPWGTMNKQGIKTVEGFHDLVVANSLKYDFLAIDFGPGNVDNVFPTIDQWVIRTKFTDLFDWVATELARVGMTGKPIVGSEVYAGLGGGANHDTEPSGLITAVKADTYRRLILGNIKYPLAWGPERTADNTTNTGAYIIDSVATVDGGTIKPWGLVNQMIKESFSAGTIIYSLVNSDPSQVEALASADKVMLINKTNVSKTVQITNTGIVQLNPYEVRVVDR